MFNIAKNLINKFTIPSYSSSNIKKKDQEEDEEDLESEIDLDSELTESDLECKLSLSNKKTTYTNSSQVASTTTSTIESKSSSDALNNVVYVKNVDFSTSVAQLERLFDFCGEIVKIIIYYDKFTNCPKG